MPDIKAEGRVWKLVKNAIEFPNSTADRLALVAFLDTWTPITGVGWGGWLKLLGKRLVHETLTLLVARRSE